MEFSFVPFVGPLPLRFGMSRGEVRHVIEEDVSHASPTRDSYSMLGVNYDDAGVAAEFCLYPECVRVILDGVVLLGSGGVPDLVAALLAREPAPCERHGFLIFPDLGVHVTGFHDGDRSQLAFNVFRRGFWDDVLAKARPYHRD